MILNILLAALGFSVLVGVGFLLIQNLDLRAKVQKAEQEERDRHQQEQCRQVENLVERFHTDAEIIAKAMEPVAQLAKNLGGLETIADLVNGLTEMTKVAAGQLDSFNRTVEILERSLSHSEQSYTDFAEDTAEGQAKAEQSKVREMLRQGIPEDQARARMREANIYEQMSRGR